MVAVVAVVADGGRGEWLLMVAVVVDGCSGY